jgi:hypothetical protein
VTTRYAAAEHTKTREYRAWINMRTRCENPRTPEYENYGGRGIRVCDRWRYGTKAVRAYECFLADMGPRPSSEHSLDRINVNGNYEPGNCRWVVRSVQMRNTRVNRTVSVDGRHMTLAEAVERAPVPYNTVLYRLKRGWTLEAALTRAPHKGLRP